MLFLSALGVVFLAVKLAGAVAATFFASAIAVKTDYRIFLRKFMAVGTVGKRAEPRGASRSGGFDVGWQPILTKNLLWCFPRIYSAQDGANGYLQDVGPLGHGFSDAPKGNKHTGALIRRLFGSRRPFAVFWTVRAIVINPLKRCSVWPIAHVLNKQGKIIPSLADSYSSAPVIYKRSVSRVETPRSHSLPSAIERMVKQAMFFTKVHSANLIPVAVGVNNNAV